MAKNTRLHLRRYDMAAINARVSTGIKGLDTAINMLRLGDNVVWQVDTVEDYRHIVAPYVAQARKDQRTSYISFRQA